MPDQPSTSCPECGAGNRSGARRCRQCGAQLAPPGATRRTPANKILRRTDFLAAARANQRATRRLVFALLVILTVLGYLIGWSAELALRGMPAPAPDAWSLSLWGFRGGFLLLVIGAVWSWIAFHSGDRLVLKLTGAEEVGADQEPVLHNVVEEMAIAAGIPRPHLYVIETDALNAFATGMSPARAAIGVTRGLLNTLNREELQGVIGHEMGHIVNWDIRYATAVGVIVGLIALVSDGALRTLFFSGRSRNSGRGGAGPALVMIVLVAFAALAPLFAVLVQFAVSRQREFLADATSVRLTRNPRGLISALEKLSASSIPFSGANRATQHMFIVNPLRNFSEQSSRLYATHPPLALRINRLRNLGAQGV
jgi:heat shock protein HtpX